MSSKTRPGDGERTAMLGFVPQYEIAANFIYDALLDDRLEWFRVADPDAGCVDDIQIATTGQLDAYQVKWGEYVNHISYADFVRDESRASGNEKPSLWKQLVNGWQQLSGLHPERTVTVHLLHKQVASANPQAKVPNGTPPPAHPHFQAFLKECWINRSWCHIGINSAPTCWTPALRELQAKSGLEEGQFLKFVLACELEFNYRAPFRATSHHQRQLRRSADVSKIYSLLTKMAGDEYRIVQLDKDQILNILAWDHRFKHRAVHDFPRPQAYQEVRETVSAISEQVNKSNAKYIALLGGPGSGKSTTLTQTLRYKSGFKLIRYYAYVPDSTYQGRGEANTFLHDVTLSLRHHGFKGSDNAQPASREEYLEHFGRQLQQAHDHWVQNKISTIIMVDGLDHIQREQNPQINLLGDLPHPNSVPEGVIFVLGSQTLELDGLSNAIKEHILNHGHAIHISRLTRENVFSAINAWPDLPCSDDSIKEKIYERSGGHPLTLVYLLQFILSNAAMDILEAINAFPAYQNHIQNNYSIYWRNICDDKDMVDLLALLSRSRRGVSSSVLQEWSNYAVLRKFTVTSLHYFTRVGDGEIRFFHNSFRQFILDRTSRNAFGDHDKSLDFAYHKKIADYCISTDNNNPFHWESVRHLSRACEFDSVLSVGTQSYLREKYLSTRNLDAVIEDIDDILNSAKKLGNGPAIVRCILIEAELRERQSAVEDIDVLNLLFATEGPATAISYMYDGETLRVDDRDALKFAKILAENSYITEAHKVFRSAEPLGYLSGSNPPEEGSNGEALIGVWAQAAHYFEPLQKVVSVIVQAKIEGAEDGPESEHEEKVHDRILSKLMISIMESGDEEKIAAGFNLMSKAEQYSGPFLNLCFEICRNESPAQLLPIALDHVFTWARENKEELSDSERLVVSEFHLNQALDPEGSRAWLEGIEQPAVYNNEYSSEWDYLAPFAARIRLNRLLAAHGLESDPALIVPFEKKNRSRGVIYERGLVRFAQIWGKAWAGEPVSKHAILQDLKPLFRLMTISRPDSEDWASWYPFERSAINFFDFVIRASAEHGAECLDAVVDAFLQEWSRTRWPPAWRKGVALSLYKEGADTDVIKAILEDVEEETSALDDVLSRITEFNDLALAWASIGESQHSKRLVPRIFEGSFGIYHRKDRQYTSWVRWLGRVVKLIPAAITQQDISRFSSALVSLQKSRNGRGTQEAASELMATVASWNPGYGYKLRGWLHNHGGLCYVPGITGMLIGLLDDAKTDLDGISSIIRRMLIPFEEHNPSEVLKLHVNRYCVSRPNDAQAEIELLVQCIKTHSLPSNRSALFQDIALAMRDAGLSNVWVADLAMSTPRNKYVTSEPYVQLASNERLNSDQVCLKASNAEEFIVIVESINEAKYFPWESIIGPYLEQMTVPQIHRLYEALSDHSPSIKVITTIANHLVKQGKVDQATELVTGLIEQSDPRGWSLNWDGGSRLSLYQLLVDINQDKWRHMAIESFVVDYIGDHRYPGNLILYLDEISSTICPESDLPVVWDEIKEHVYQLDCFNDDTEVPPDFSPGSEALDAKEVLVKVVFELFDLDVPEIALMAHKSIIDLSKSEDNWRYIRNEILNRIQAPGLIQAKALSILQSLASLGNDLIFKFKDDIEGLCSSSDYSVRIICESLAPHLKISRYNLKAKSNHLPLAYQIELAKVDFGKEALPISAMAPGEILLDVDDPVELIRPLLSLASLISKCSGIPIENIAFRAADLMKSLVPPESWNKSAEATFKGWLEHMELKLTYSRLKPRIAKYALSHVVAELIDAQKIPSQAIQILKIMLSRSDELLLLAEPVNRPECVFIPDDGNHAITHSHNAWLSNIKLNDMEFAREVHNDTKIVAEMTHWIWLDWNTPSEYRLSAVGYADLAPAGFLESPSDFFPCSMLWRADSYPHIVVKEPSLAILGTGGYSEHGHYNWLALNPEVGFSLGWQPSSTGLFRWEDQHGAMMAESIYWKDGPIARLPPKFDDLCSEGWLVIASDAGMQQLTAVLGDEAVKTNMVIRTVGPSSTSPETNASIAVEPY